MATTKIEHPSVAERKARGKELRERVPHAEHSGWQPASDRPDPSRCSRRRTPPANKITFPSGTVG